MHYFAPYKADGVSLNTLRSNEALLDNVAPLTWGLREVLQFAEVLLNKDDVDAKADALIDFIRERVVDKRLRGRAAPRQPHRCGRSPISRRGSAMCSRAWRRRTHESWRTHHVATIRKVRNRLSNISTRCAGLVTDDGHVSDLPFGSFRGPHGVCGGRRARWKKTRRI